MDFKALHLWVELVDCGSFSAAAEKLSVSQSTVSKIIQALEDELGVALLQKGQAGRKRLVLPTEIGQMVYERARHIVQQVGLLQEDVVDYQNHKIGTLRIGISLLGSRLLTPAFFEFHQRWPGIELAFLEEGAHTIEKALLANQLDAGRYWSQSVLILTALVCVAIP
ncbi:LysR family transcriptional regulator [Snodgrassella sp. CFCC 13594]|uniref:LysR family transcriptional regulator n=1 Tax=Snodgrassella sp. CFCC 13594 TaxID=1775559 RepID=UPI000B12F9A3|nr:LysR family transcriptional regulator [Snodgrassella sp. CFCC 13594]